MPRHTVLPSQKILESNSAAITKGRGKQCLPWQTVPALTKGPDIDSAAMTKGRGKQCCPHKRSSQTVLSSHKALVDRVHLLMGELCLSGSHTMTEYKMSGGPYTQKRGWSPPNGPWVKKSITTQLLNTDHIDCDYPIIFPQLHEQYCRFHLGQVWRKKLHTLGLSQKYMVVQQ